MISVTAATKTIIATNSKAGLFGGLFSMVLGFFIAGHGTILLSLLTLIAIDMLTGLTASLKNSKKIESGLLMKGLVKIFLYMLCAIAVIQLDTLLLPYIAANIVSTFVFGYIGSVEFVSILENLQKVGLKVPDIKKVIPQKLQDKNE